MSEGIYFLFLSGSLALILEKGMKSVFVLYFNENYVYIY